MEPSSPLGGIGTQFPDLFSYWLVPIWGPKSITPPLIAVQEQGIAVPSVQARKGLKSTQALLDHTQNSGVSQHSANFQHLLSTRPVYLVTHPQCSTGHHNGSLPTEYKTIYLTPCAGQKYASLIHLSVWNEHVESLFTYYSSNSPSVDLKFYRCYTNEMLYSPLVTCICIHWSLKKYSLCSSVSVTLLTALGSHWLFQCLFLLYMLKAELWVWHLSVSLFCVIPHFVLL